ncbi:MAG: multiheme c-type cytochrome [Pseudomonadota bacterium]
MHNSRAAPPMMTRQARTWLGVMLLLLALLYLNSVYMGITTWRQWLSGHALETELYQWAFLLHLAIGLLVSLFALAFLTGHLRLARRASNRRAQRRGGLLAIIGAILICTGLALTDLIGSQGDTRATLYILHIFAGCALPAVFVYHRRAGRRIRWFWAAPLLLSGIGAAYATHRWHTAHIDAATLEHPVGAPVLAAQDPQWMPRAPTAPARAVFADRKAFDTSPFLNEQCGECHTQAHAEWTRSAHRFASFNNPAYRAVVSNLRAHLLQRDGHVRQARLCAGCHDPLPLFSGEFDDPQMNMDSATAQAGITCLTCHGISRVEGHLGNGAYTLSAPGRYPFANSRHPVGRWLHRQLIRANPDFHKRSLLKPLHQRSEFCAACHKVHLPQELNHFHWLRGQNHYDSFLLSGFSGHSVASFNYPPQALDNCAACHMPERDVGERTHRSHHFAAANPTLGHLRDAPYDNTALVRERLEDALSVDLFAMTDTTTGTVSAPLSHMPPELHPDRSYWVDVVVRNRKVGHAFTQGTADSNQAWLALTLSHNGRKIAASGALDEERAVDPHAHFVNTYAIRADGQRIAAREVEHMVGHLYDHQIPAGGTDVIRYRIRVPKNYRPEDTLSLTASLNYRKFSNAFVHSIEPQTQNRIPIITIATDRWTSPRAAHKHRAHPSGERWLDYGVGWLLKNDDRAIERALSAFVQAQREPATRDAALLNEARGHWRLGRLDVATKRLAEINHSPTPWTQRWLRGQIDFVSGDLNAAIEAFEDVLRGDLGAATTRGFDFSKDYRLHNRLAAAYFERAKQAGAQDAQADLDLARHHYQQTLQIDPENAAAHYGLAQWYTRRSDSADAADRATWHERAYLSYRGDETALAGARAKARLRDPVGAAAADPLHVYPLLPVRRQTTTERLTAVPHNPADALGGAH